jgi:hypothetical protein
MPPPPRVTQLPEPIRDALEKRLIDSAFSGYLELKDWLRQQIAEYNALLDQQAQLALVRGDFGAHLAALAEKPDFDSIGKSALHNYGRGLKRKLAAIQASTHAAKMIAEAAPDEEDRRSEALMSLLQTDLFGMLVNLQEAEDADPEERVKLLSTAARAIADVSRASIHQKKHAATVKAKFDALMSEAETGHSSLDVATLQRIRQEVYGLAA